MSETGRRNTQIKKMRRKHHDFAKEGDKERGVVKRQIKRERHAERTKK